MAGNCGTYDVIGQGAFRVQWALADGAVLSLVANLSAEPLEEVEVWSEDHLWLEGFATGSTLEAWSVVFRLTKPK
jgi:maltooligosyltrehalose trehalohydrolase